MKQYLLVGVALFAAGVLNAQSNLGGIKGIDIIVKKQPTGANGVWVCRAENDSRPCTAEEMGALESEFQSRQRPGFARSAGGIGSAVRLGVDPRGAVVCQGAGRGCPEAEMQRLAEYSSSRSTPSPPGNRINPYGRPLKQNTAAVLRRPPSGAAVSPVCPAGTVWDAAKRECAGDGLVGRFPPGAFAGMRAGTYPVTDRRTGRPAGNFVIRADGSGEVPVAVYSVKEGEGDEEGEGGCVREVCNEAGKCFEYKPLPADENYFTELPIDDVKLNLNLCGGKSVLPVIVDRLGKAILKGGQSGF